MQKNNSDCPMAERLENVLASLLKGSRFHFL